MRMYLLLLLGTLTLLSLIVGLVVREGIRESKIASILAYFNLAVAIVGAILVGLGYLSLTMLPRYQLVSANFPDYDPPILLDDIIVNLFLLGSPLIALLIVRPIRNLYRYLEGP